MAGVGYRDQADPAKLIDFREGLVGGKMTARGVSRLQSWGQYSQQGFKELYTQRLIEGNNSMLKPCGLRLSMLRYHRLRLFGTGGGGQ